MEYEDNTDGHVWQVYESYKVTDPNARGSVSGTVKSFNSASDKVTVQLIQQGHSEPAYETIVPSGTKEGNQYTASYTISGVASGTYTMRVLKKNHVTREYTITVGGEAVTQNAKIHLKGDINGDGKITIGDVNRAKLQAKGKSKLTLYEFACADINGDGKITISDVNRANLHVKGKSLLW